MNGSRILRASALVVAASVTLTATPAADAATQNTAAISRPSKKLAAVSGLTAEASAAASGYVVRSTWAALAGATSYRVRLVDAATGVTLASGSVTDTTWSARTSLHVGDWVSVRVTAMAGKRPGSEARFRMQLPDVTAPSATYSVERTVGNETNGDVKIHRESLVDDLSAANAIKQTVIWGDGGAAQDWPTSEGFLAHSYGDAPKVYYPTITVADAAGNTSTVDLTIVVSDSTAPTGSFSVTRTAGFARWTKVSVRGNVDDNLSAPEKVTRMVDWGDATPTQTWTGDTAPKHVYAAGGTYTPTVTLTDEAGNDSVIKADPVSIAVDATGPKVRLRKPAARRSAVTSWTRLHGKATDAGVGVRKVRLQAVEKRGAKWYAYRPATGTWVRAGATKAVALRKAPVAAFRPAADGSWNRRLKRLTKGTLVVRVSGVDRLGNKAPWSTTSKRLVRR